MNFIIEEFEMYKVFLNSGKDDATAVMYINLPSGKAVIKFSDGNVKSNSTKPMRDDKTLYQVYVHDKYYPNYIDILRNEKPIFFYFNLKTKESYITTSDEPVGEAEGEGDE